MTFRFTHFLAGCCLALFLIGCGQSENANSTQGEQEVAPKDNYAWVIVDFNDGAERDREVFCINLGSEQEISGLKALRETGLPVAENHTFICNIDGVGCPDDDCACGCEGYDDPNCRFWAYWHFVDGEWQFSKQGAGDYQVSEGDVDYWIWGNDKTVPALAEFKACP